MAGYKGGESVKRPSLLRVIFLVIVFIMVSVGSSFGYNVFFSGIISNTFMRVLLSVLCGVGSAVLLLALTGDFKRLHDMFFW